MRPMYSDGFRFFRSWLSRPAVPLVPERLRSFQIFLRIYLFVTLVHMAFFPVLLWIGKPLLTMLNLLCILANLFAIGLHRHGQLAAALLLKVGTVTALFVVAGMTLGCDIGFEYYFFILMLEVLISDLPRRFKLPLSVLLMALLLSMVHGWLGTLDSRTLDPLAKEVLLTLNLSTTFLLLMFIVMQVYSVTVFTEQSVRSDASHDVLTGVLNRRAVHERAEAVWQQSSSLALIIVDADHFKRFNDRYGHSAGDEVLCHIARSLQEAIREGDFIGRVGGEEFLILLPDATRDEAHGIATRLREQLALHPCRYDRLTLPVTLSMGLVMSNESASLHDAIDLADRRLYMAKSRGRDRLVADGAESFESLVARDVAPMPQEH